MPRVDKENNPIAVGLFSYKLFNFIKTNKEHGNPIEKKQRRSEVGNCKKRKRKENPLKQADASGDR